VPGHYKRVVSEESKRMVTGVCMAKKLPAKPKEGRSRTKVEYLQFRMSGGFKAWLERYADSRNLTMADVIAQDLIRGAKIEGFEQPPKR
jgi:hypothetical protein